MILRAIHIENWRCIRRLDLTNLPEGIILVHGPNRTGKSSLIQALRSCLFDADHDSAGRDIQSSLPWSRTGPPKVAVAFSLGDITYRITKVFSKKKDGLARLEKRTGSAWTILEDAPKEAARMVREMLGADKSSTGLNQLMWLTQGEVGLPERRAINATLAGKVVNLLGMMVTARDFQFQQKLDERCARWFTPQGHRKKNSPMVQWEAVLLEKTAKLEDEKRKFEHWEAALQQMQQYEDELPGLREKAEQATRAVTALKQEQEQCQARLRAFSDATTMLNAARIMRDQAAAKVAAFQDAKKRLDQTQQTAVEANRAVQMAEERWRNADADHKKQRATLDGLREEENRHLQGRDEIDERRRLVHLIVQQEQLEKQRAADLARAQEMATLEAQLAGAPAPDEKQLAALRANRRHATDLRAALQAAELTLTITLERSLPMHVRLDDQEARATEALPEAPHVWHVRQRAEVTLVGIGRIAVARARENLDLDRMAQDLARCDDDFKAAVTSFHEDPADETCLDRLAQRRQERLNQTQRLRELHAAAPNNNPDGQAGTVASQIQSVLEHCPRLANWQPSAVDVEAAEKNFKIRATELAAQRQQQETATTAAGNQLRQFETVLQRLKQTQAAATSAEQAARHEVERLGDESQLQTEFAHHQHAWELAEKKAAEHQLTDAERTSAARLQAAETALHQRNQVLGELEGKMRELRGELRGNEGLHVRLSDAAGAVQEAEAALAREHIESEAHKRLHALFDACRENQVQRVMTPIAARVLDWAHLIGLEDYREIRFDDCIVPEAILRAQGVGSGTVTAVDTESYGTIEQLSLLVRLALGGILARDEPLVAVLDDPLTHTDAAKHRKLLEVLRVAAAGDPTLTPPAGPLQLLIITCHPEKYEPLAGASRIDWLEALKNSKKNLETQRSSLRASHHI